MGEIPTPPWEQNDYPECPECGCEDVNYIGEDYCDVDNEIIDVIHVFECPECGEEFTNI